MKKDKSSLKKFRVIHPLINDYGDDDNMCIIIQSPIRNDLMFCICSSGGGWEHVSVSLKSKKMPTWNEMCFIKDLFWEKNEAVIQIHPPESEYINNHSSCLHLWKKIDFEMPLPNPLMVGLKELNIKTNSDMEACLQQEQER